MSGRLGARWSWMLVACGVAVAACGAERSLLPGQAVTDVAVLVVEQPPPALGRGERLALAVRASTGNLRRVAAFDGTLTFDPGTLRLVGQGAQPTGFSVANLARAGTGAVTVAAVAPEAGSVAQAVLVFEAVRSGPAGPIAFAPTAAYDSAVAELPVTLRTAMAARGSAAPAIEPAEQGIARWARTHAARADVAIAARGPFSLYGDLNGTGSISSGDLVLLANASVGNIRALGDGLVAANVAPANAPGLGEAGDPVPPGTEADGRRRISSGDVLLLSNYLVGNPVAIVGQPVPPERLGPRVVVTPSVLEAGVATPACSARISAGTQWLDAAQGIPQPDCVDAIGRPMVAQFCGYVKDTAGTWSGVVSTAAAPRCAAELPGVTRGWQ